MSMIKYTYQDIMHAAINQQETARGTSVSPVSVNATFFITSIDNATSANPATIKNVAGTIITIVNSDKEYFVPIRLEGGFTVEAPEDDVTVKYFKIERGIQ